MAEDLTLQQNRLRTSTAGRDVAFSKPSRMLLETFFLHNKYIHTFLFITELLLHFLVMKLMQFKAHHEVPTELFIGVFLRYR